MRTIKTSLLMAILLGANGVAAQVFECSFVTENRPDGKSNLATCAMNPEKVFSTSSYTPKKWQHCDVSGVYSIENLEDVIVDASRKSVVWTEVNKIADHAVDRQVKFSLSQKDNKRTKEELVKSYTTANKSQQSFSISNYQEYFSSRYFDKKLNKMYESEKRVKHYLINFSSNRYNYSLNVAEDNNQAVLTSFHADGEDAWVRLRFGHCVRKN